MICVKQNRLWRLMMDLLNLVGSLWKKNDTAAVPAPVVVHRAPTALEERQQLLAHHVRLVSRGMANGLAVYGSRGGLGKTRVVLATLKEEGLKPLVLNGHITPLSLYTNLYERPDSILFLDDCDSLFRNLPALGILRSALWGETNEKRLVTYNCSQLKIPSSFFFTGRIVFAINTLPMKNHAFNAVLSRVDQFELTASNEEVLDLMRELAAQGFEELTPADCLQVVDYIAEFSATRELSSAAAGAVVPESPLCTQCRGGLAATRRQPAPRDRSHRRPEGEHRTGLRLGMPAAGRGGLWKCRRPGGGVPHPDPAYPGDVLPAEERAG